MPSRAGVCHDTRPTPEAREARPAPSPGSLGPDPATVADAAALNTNTRATATNISAANWVADYSAVRFGIVKILTTWW